jgi:hypothetical protein
VEQAHAELACSPVFVAADQDWIHVISAQNIPTMSGSNSAFELRFRHLFKPGRAFAFPCDAEGNVDLGGMSERCRESYFLRSHCCWFGSGCAPGSSLQTRMAGVSRGCVKTRLGSLWKNNDALDRARIDFLDLAKDQRTP